MIEHRPSQTAKTYAAILLVACLVSLSWIRPIDVYTEDYLSESITTAAVIFAISRTINAAISVIQSGEVGIGVASVAPGEALDPINDLIERFSEVMTVSLVSLAFQQILLEIVSHWLFNVLVSLSALALLGAWWRGRYRRAATSMFAFFVIIRLLLPVVVFANSIVDQAFIESKVVAEKDEMEKLETSVSMAAKQAADDEIDDLGQRLEDLSQRIEMVQSSIVGLETKIAVLNEATPSRPWWRPPDIFNGDPEVEKDDQEIRDLERQLKDLQAELDDLTETKATLTEERDCLQKRARGEACSWVEMIDRARKWVTGPTFDIGDKVESLITLMALIVLRSILLPIAFWYLIYKSVRWVWRLWARV